jgi:hypothetical protein
LLDFIFTARLKKRIESRNLGNIQAWFSSEFDMFVDVSIGPI